MWSWVVYDLANTIFALGVIGRYFPGWLLSVGQPDSALAVVEAVAGVIVIFLAPWAGARSDARGARLPTLRVTTVIAVAATAFLAAFSLNWTLVLLGVALVAFNIGAVAYDALLVDVSTPENRGRISGLGCGRRLHRLLRRPWYRPGHLGGPRVVLRRHFPCPRTRIPRLRAAGVLFHRGAWRRRRRSDAPLPGCGVEDGRLLAVRRRLSGRGAVPGGEVSLHRRHQHPDRRVPHLVRDRGARVRGRTW